MPLDPKAQWFLDEAAKADKPPLHEQTPAEARAQEQTPTPGVGPGEEVAHVEDRTVPGPGGEIPVRVYKPDAPEPLPVVVYYHGGGWVLNSIDTHDGLCRALANRTGHLVVSVGYRKAPEHPYPAAVEDAYAAASWVSINSGLWDGDPGRITVMGDSCGGNLAAAVALMARDQLGPPLAKQVLNYPILDHDFDTESYLANAEGYMLTRSAMQWFWDRYAPDVEQRDEPYASPLRAKDLGSLPPALILTAEYDPLRTEAELYAKRLLEADVPVNIFQFDGMIHGFMRRNEYFPQAEKALTMIAEFLK